MDESLPRLAFGILADRYGGRNVTILLLLFCAIPTYPLAHAENWRFRLYHFAAFGAYVGLSAWLPNDVR